MRSCVRACARGAGLSEEEALWLRDRHALLGLPPQAFDAWLGLSAGNLDDDQIVPTGTIPATTALSIAVPSRVVARAVLLDALSLARVAEARTAPHFPKYCDTLVSL